MTTKFLVFLLSPFLLLTLFTRNIDASEKPKDEVTPSESVYADLALRHELDHVGVYYFDDNIANTISLNADKSWDPASTIKLFVAMYAFDQVAAGNISLDQQITIEEKNVAPSESFPNGYPLLQAGNTVSIYELLDRMITQSGNTSYNTLLGLLDRSQVTKYIHDLGLTNSSVGAKLNLDDTQAQEDSKVPGYGPNVTNANDYATAFILINGRRIQGATSLFDMLSRQKFNTMMPLLLPKDVLVAHKTGELDPFYHDGGIVVASPERKYILSIFSDAGDPNLVAHISQLVYTKDTNLIGTDINQKLGQEETPNAPIDPIVASGEVGSNVLAANTENIKVPKFSASDIGINTSDLTSAISLEKLPTPLIPAGSPLHFLADLVDSITSKAVPPGQLKVLSETGKLKLKLAESLDLIHKGERARAENILAEIDERLAIVAKDKSVAQNPSLQAGIDQVSETRFSILKSELDGSSKEDRPKIIKEIAKEARNTTQNVTPFIKDSIKNKDLSQKPKFGEVVRTTPFSITIKAEDGREETVFLPGQTKTRSQGKTDIQVQSPGQIATGTKIALAGQFILTDIPDELVNSKPGTILKVNAGTKTLVLISEKGKRLQVDLGNRSIIKGADTSISLNELVKGDVVVVQGIRMNAPSFSPPNGSPSLSTPSGGTSTQKSGTTTQSGGQNTGQGGPVVINAKVVKVLEKVSDTKLKANQKEQKKETRNPIPPATPTNEKEKK